MLEKARQRKHVRHPTILSRWYASESYRNSLYAIGWREKQIMLYDRIAMEKHIYVATNAEIIQHSKHSSLTKIQKDLKQPLNQRPDFAQAKRECKRLHDEHLARTQEEYRTILRKQHVRQRKGQQFDCNEEYDYTVDPKTGWRFYKQSRRNLQTTQDRRPTCKQLRHRRQRGTNTIRRRAIGILSILPSPDDWRNFSQS